MLIIAVILCFKPLQYESTEVVLLTIAGSIFYYLMLKYLYKQII